MKAFCGLAVCCLALAMAIPGTAQTAPIRVQLVTGGHAHTLSFYRIFDGADDLKISVNPHPAAFQSDLRKSIDVLVLYDMADLPTDRERENLRQFAEAGKGIVVLHHALIDNQNWPWWSEELLDGRYYLKAEPGHPASTYQHDVTLKIRKVADHPVLDGISDFEIFDEAYGQYWVSPKVKVLLETDHAASMKQVAWISPYSNSRVVFIQIGHGKEAHENATFRKLVNNAIHWSAAR